MKERLLQENKSGKNYSNSQIFTGFQGYVQCLQIKQAIFAVCEGRP